MIPARILIDPTVSETSDGFPTRSQQPTLSLLKVHEVTDSVLISILEDRETALQVKSLVDRSLTLMLSRRQKMVREPTPPRIHRFFLIDSDSETVPTR